MFAFNAKKCVICYLLSNLKSKKITVENKPDLSFLTGPVCFCV